jgi:CheY-like chemotaxis protein
MANSIHIALIDDDPAVLDSLQLYFSRRQIKASCFNAAEEFLAAVDRSERFDCVTSDVRMPGISGLELVRQLNARGLMTPIILITGHGDIDMQWLRSSWERSISSKSHLMSIVSSPASTRPSNKDDGEQTMLPSWKKSSRGSIRCRIVSVRLWNWPSPDYRARKSAHDSRSARKPLRTIGLGSWNGLARAI